MSQGQEICLLMKWLIRIWRIPSALLLEGTKYYKNTGYYHKLYLKITARHTVESKFTMLAFLAVWKHPWSLARFVYNIFFHTNGPEHAQLHRNLFVKAF